MTVSAIAASPVRIRLRGDRPGEVAASWASESSCCCRCPCALRRWIACTPTSAARNITEIAYASCLPRVMRSGSRVALALEALEEQVPVADLPRRAAPAARLDPDLLVVEAV